MSKFCRSMIRLWCGVAACALLAGAAVTPARANPVSSLVVFGDSSSDLGSLGPALRPTNKGRMWSERLADNLGLPMKSAREFRLNAAGDGFDILRPGGSSYAVNGSTVLDFDCCLSLREQIDFFVADRKQFRGDELVAIYLDRNDIETAFLEGAPYSAGAFATEYVRQVERLKSLGARNIISLGWELDLIPAQFALDTGRATPETLAALRAETAKQRETLFPQLQKLNVFLVDLDRVGNDILANPGKYGFSTTRDSYQQRGNPNPPPSQSLADDGNVFTLDGHLTSAAQAVVADYVLAQLRARDQYAGLLTQSALDQRTAKDAFAAFRAVGAPGWRVFASPYAGRIDQKADGQLDAAFDQTYRGLSLGARRTLDGGFTVGGGVSVRGFEGDFAGARGKAKGASGLVTLFAVLPVAPGVTVDAFGALGATDFSEIERRAALGNVARERVMGSTEGRQASAGVGVRAQRDVGDWVVSARAGAEVERTTIDGFVERSNVLALTYGDSHVDAALGRLDLTIARGGGHRWRPFLTASVAHDVLDDDIEVQVGPSAQTVVTYATRRGVRTQLDGQLGIDVQLADSWDVRASLTQSVWSGSGGEAHAGAVIVQLSRSF